MANWHRAVIEGRTYNINLDQADALTIVPVKAENPDQADGVDEKTRYQVCAVWFHPEGEITKPLITCDDEDDAANRMAHLTV